MNLDKCIEELIAPALAQENFELVDVERQSGNGRTCLRLYVDKKKESPGEAQEEVYASTITLDDCQAVSQKVSEILDRENVILESYVLEVSSPGIYRRLKKENDFLRFLNHRIRVKLYEPIEGQKNLIGFIRGVENMALLLETIENKNITVDLDKIAKASLYPEIKI